MERGRHPDAFAALNPALNLTFFLAALVWTVLLRHPAYTLVSLLAGALYYRALLGRKAWRTFGSFLILMLALTALNPLFNPRGAHPLFALLGRPYTLESLCYGASAAGMFAAALLWFFCYGQVVTEDKLTAVLGRRLPALSLLLVMVLRLVPAVGRRARQISGARRCVGLSGGDTLRERIETGMTTLSALSGAMLEGSVITADSMRARGYGTAKRTSFQIYRMNTLDWILIAVMLTLAGVAAVVAAMGGAAAEFTPKLAIQPVTGIYAPGFIAYCAYLFIPSALHMKEAVQWHISRSRI